jgi:hypothetical protein
MCVLGGLISWVLAITNIIFWFCILEFSDSQVGYFVGFLVT